MTSGVLAVDQGTSGSKAILVAPDGQVISRGHAALSARYPHPGWVEQDAAEIWASVVEAIRRCLRQVPGVLPTALAVTNQRESAVVWERATGAAAGPVVGWQDSRTADVCERLRAEGREPFIQHRTGLAVDPMFSATKLRWLLERAPGGMAAAQRGDLCAGTIDSWLVWKLTGGDIFAVEAGNASRTQLMDLRTLAWDPELLDLFGVPAAALPEIRRSDAGFGVTAGAGGIPAGLPIAAVLADSHAALYGNGCHAPGTGKATYGTGSSVMTPIDAVEDHTDGVSQTLAWHTDRPTWALEGNIIASGAAIEWMAQIVGAGTGAKLERMAAQVDATGGVHFVPAFAGLGAPYWDRHAEGVIVGLTRGTTPEHLARAALEAVAFQICDVLDAIAATDGGHVDVLYADGGASVSPIVMQLQADLSGRAVLARDVPEMSALGVAYLAGLTTGVWADADAVASLPRPTREYRPAIAADERESRRAAWRAAVARARGQAVETRTEVHA